MIKIMESLETEKCEIEKIGEEREADKKLLK